MHWLYLFKWTSFSCDEHLIKKLHRNLTTCLILAEINGNYVICKAVIALSIDLMLSIQKKSVYLEPESTLPLSQAQRFLLKTTV